MYYHNKNDWSIIKKDCLGVRKHVWGINFLVGMQQYEFKRILVDYHAGIGIRLKYITAIYKEYNDKTDILDHPVDINIPSITRSIEAKGDSVQHST